MIGPARPPDGSYKPISLFMIIGPGLRVVKAESRKNSPVGRFPQKARKSPSPSSPEDPTGPRDHLPRSSTSSSLISTIAMNNSWAMSSMISGVMRVASSLVL